MAIKLSSYRVSAEMDAAGYVAGAQAKVGADNAMSASAARVAVTQTQTTKVNQAAGDVLTRLSRSYVEGFSQAEKFNRAVATLGRGIETNNVTMEQADRILAGIYAKFQMTANAADLLEQGHYQLAAAVTALNARFTTEEAVLDSNTAALQRNAAASNAMMQQRRNTMFQLTDIAQGVPLLFQSPGYGLLNIANQMAQVSQAYYGQGGMAAALKDMGSIVGGLVTKFAPLAALLAAVTVAFAAVQNEINKTSEVSVSFTDVVSGAFDLLGDSIFKELAPIAGWFDQLWDQITPGIAGQVNWMIGSFVLAYDNIKTYWSMLPAALGDIAVRTLNGIMTAIETFLNENRLKIASFMLQVAPALGPMSGPTIQAAGGLMANKITMGQVANPWEGAETDFQAQMGQNAVNAYGTNWIGEIGNRAKSAALARIADDAGGAEKATKSLADKGFGKLIEQVNVFADATRSAFSNLGTGIIEAFQKGGNVAANILDMIMDRVGQLGESLLNKGLNSLFDIGINALFGGGLPTASSLGQSGMYGWEFLKSANGNIFSGPGIHAFSNTIVDRPTVFPFAKGIGLMGEAGEEAIMPLRRNSRGQLGVVAANSNTPTAGNDNWGSLEIHNHIHVPEGTNPETAPAIAREVAKELKAQLPDAIAKHNRNPLRRTG